MYVCVCVCVYIHFWLPLLALLNFCIYYIIMKQNYEQA